MPVVANAPEPPEERPRSVTIIGWIFLVLSLLRVLSDSLSWIVWKLGDAGTVVTFFMPPGTRGLAANEMVLRQLPSIVAVQGAMAACVAFVSFNFLRLRPWARPALEIVCWFAVAVITAIAAALVFERERLASGPESSGLSIAIAAVLGLDLLFGAVISTVRSRRVRDAFRRSPAAESGTVS